MAKLLGWLLGLENVSEVHVEAPTLAAPWARDNPFWLLVALVVLCIVAAIFYLRWQPRGSKWKRIGLAVMRSALLVLLLITLADPVVRLVLTNQSTPLLYLVIDGTESMSIADQYADAEQDALYQAVNYQPPNAANDTEETTSTPPASQPAAGATRLELVKSYLSREENNLLERLVAEKGYRIEPFLFDGVNTSRLRKLQLPDGEEVQQWTRLTEQLRTDGQVTALGSAIEDIRDQFAQGDLQAVLLFSDFANNSGQSPLAKTGGVSAAEKVQAPLFTIGVGAIETIDLAVDLQTDPKMKKAERSLVQVKLRQTGLVGRTVGVSLLARPMSGEAASLAEPIMVGQRQVTIQSAFEIVEFPYTPEESGKFEFIAKVDPISEEVVAENNTATREVNIIDDYLRLMYVAYEPEWEWRFIKEVFHRDKLVGMEGFRTYLASSDPRVRENNVLFLSTLTPQRSEFFANDVIFLGDMPRVALSDRFCEMTKEYVSVFGGGLVVITGPRFGLSELAETPLADMLPVIIDRESRINDEREYFASLTPHAFRYPFMQLGENDTENDQAWSNMGRLPWYQPVAGLHEQAYSLMEHPTDYCRDGKTKQPLIAIRQYGNGEVIYLAQNEMWRLRRQYGEVYYRKFWSQLIYRLGMSHALGSEKRFVTRSDRRQYRAEERALITVEAYDSNFSPLDQQSLEGTSLEATWHTTTPDGGEEQSRSISIPLLRSGVFEARLPLYTPGQHRIQVKDPITGQFREIRFEVASVSAERRSAVRDVNLQQAIAQQTGGTSYDLTTADRLLAELPHEVHDETTIRQHRLWTTPLWFILIVGLMLGEWFFRKLIHLP